MRKVVDPVREREQALLRDTEDIVTQARLDKIERQSKSIGALLDNRQIYKLDEPRRVTLKDMQRERKELMKDKMPQGIGGQTENGEELDVNVLIEFEERGEYRVEHQIWKEKSTPLSYTQKRRYQYPELHMYKEAMDRKKQLQFRKRASDTLVALSNKYREECKVLKTVMDSNSIFHPEANAHRVHCIYLMKLYKGILSENIEDPVLRQMMREEEEQKAKELRIKEQKEQLLRSMEAADYENLSPEEKQALYLEKEKEALEDKDKDLSASAVLSQGQEVQVAVENKLTTGEAKKIVKLRSKSRSVPVLRKSLSSKKGLPVASDVHTVLGSPDRRKLKESNSTPHLGGGGKGKGDTEVVNPEASQASLENSVGLSPAQKAKEREEKKNEKLFKKIKANRMGWSDASVLLTEEASRLESAPVHNAKPTRERNNILVNEMSNWMLSSIQRHQIQKTAAGAAMLTGTGLSQYPKINPSPLITEFNDSVKYQSSSPSRMMPFDQFHTMFRQYSHQRLNPASPKTTTEKLSKSRANKRRSLNSEDMNSALLEAAAAVNAAMAGTHLQPTATHPLEPINAVKLLADYDPQFNSYMKVAMNKLDTLSPIKAKTLKLNSKISTKSQRIRKSIPLGRDAVQLVDSWGMPSKESSKGFNNVFVEREEEEVEEQQQLGVEATDETNEETVRSKVNVSIEEGDVMGRLAHRAYRATFSDQLDDSHNKGALSLGDFSPAAKVSQSIGGMESPGELYDLAIIVAHCVFDWLALLCQRLLTALRSCCIQPPYS